MTLRNIRLHSSRQYRGKRRNHGRAQGKQDNGAMLEETIHGQPVLFIWFVWFVLFIWLNQTNSMN